jgi:Phosphotransferase enzyme family
MKPETRKKVLWLGGDPPPGLMGELLARGGLRLQPSLQHDLLSQAAESRGLVIEFAGSAALFRKYVDFARRVLLDHGLSIALVTGPSANGVKFQEVLEEIRMVPEEPVRVFYAKWAAAAEWLATADPGPGSNPRLKTFGAKVTADHRLLLRRAFWDFSSIHITKVKGGASGAAVYIVQPQQSESSRPQRLLPYLAKIDIPRRVRGELDKFQQFVCDSVPFNHRPNLILSRVAYGRTSAVLVEDFIDRANPLREILRTANASVVVASLFEGALRGWRLCAVRRKQSLGEFYQSINVLRTSTALDEAAELAMRVYRTGYSAKALLAKLLSLPAIECLFCNIHGDFHAGNIFVSTGSTETFLIDFYKTTEGPAVSDPACLEVDLLFKHGAALDESFLRSLYKYPLGVPSLDARRPNREWLWDSVRAIRMFGILAEGDSKAYMFAVVAYLLRFASYPDNGPLKTRALAFALAVELTEQLISHV